MKYFILALLVTMFNFNLYAQTEMTKDGVSMPTKITVGDAELILNGLGTRKATFLKIKVYVGGLYLSEKSSNPDSFLNDGKTKRIVMDFVRDVGKKDLNKAWQEGFDAVSKDQNLIKDGITKLLDIMDDVKKEDKIIFTFYSDKVEVSIKDKTPVTIDGNTFSSSLLSIWFVNARDSGLRDGLLGK